MSSQLIGALPREEENSSAAPVGGSQMSLLPLLCACVWPLPFTALPAYQPQPFPRLPHTFQNMCLSQALHMYLALFGVFPSCLICPLKSFSRQEGLTYDDNGAPIFFHGIGRMRCLPASLSSFGRRCYSIFFPICGAISLHAFTTQPPSFSKGRDIVIQKEEEASGQGRRACL